MGDERIRLGEVGIDSGQLLVIDPCYLHDWDHERSYGGGRPHHHVGTRRAARVRAAQAGPGGSLVVRLRRRTYEVWATVRDFGPVWGRRVVQVEIDLLGEEEDT